MATSIVITHIDRQSWIACTSLTYDREPHRVLEIGSYLKDVFYMYL